MVRVLVWNEFLHEQRSEHIAALYPEGIHGAIAAGLRPYPDLQVSTATMDQPDQGLSEATLAQTDVLVYWSHIGQGDFPEAAVDRVQQRVLAGMGLVLLHSACISKIFRRLLGTTGEIKWREAGEKQRLWVVAPGHPIVAGLPECFEVEADEMYGEHFDIPPPEELVFISWFPGGEVCRTGCCFTRGQGKIFYFQPGHETYPVYYNENVLRVIANAVHWAAPVAGPQITRGNVKPLEPLD
jgi:trehalose utilization protein